MVGPMRLALEVSTFGVSGKGLRTPRQSGGRSPIGARARATRLHPRRFVVSAGRSAGCPGGKPDQNRGLPGRAAWSRHDDAVAHMPPGSCPSLPRLTTWCARPRAVRQRAVGPGAAGRVVGSDTAAARDRVATVRRRYSYNRGPGTLDRQAGAEIFSMVNMPPMKIEPNGPSHPGHHPEGSADIPMHQSTMPWCP